MNNMQLTFNSEIKMKEALNQIAINMNCNILSINAETKEIDNKAQKTIGWSIGNKAYNKNIWYFEKPKSEFMINVVDYEEQEMNPEWIEPTEV